MTGLNLQTKQVSVALKGRLGPILSGFFFLVFFSKLSTCLQDTGDSRQHESKEFIYVTLRDGLNFRMVKKLVDSSALGLPMDYLGPTASDSLAIQLITASTATAEVVTIVCSRSREYASFAEAPSVEVATIHYCAWDVLQ